MEGRLCESPYVSNNSDVPYLNTSPYTYVLRREKKSEHDILW